MAKNTHTLSIIIPAYNEERYLKQCLQAISGQSEKPDEVIVVDNNSTDDTAAIARSFPFVRLIYEKKQGLYYSRQTGMASATGDILCRIDADTIVDTGWVKAIRKSFADPAVHAATGPVGYHDWAIPRVTLRMEDVMLRVTKMGGYHFLMGPNMAVRRSAWDIIKDELCNEPFLFEDIDIATHLKMHGIIPRYVPSMRAMVSARRFHDSPREFIQYNLGHTRTIHHHDLPAPLGAYLAQGSFGLIYFGGGKLLYKAYDPNKRKFSARRLFKTLQRRPNPMTKDNRKT